MHTNPLINSSKLPGQTIRLPSNGIFYKNGELDENVKNGEVHIYPLTAYHEILLKSPDLLLNGVAVEKVFIDCIPEIKKPLELITKDVDYLFINLRRITFGDEIEYEYTHYCENPKNNKYFISISNLLTNTVIIDPTTIDNKFIVKLTNGYKVNINPLRFKDFITLNQIPTNTLVSPEDKFKFVIDSLLTTISSVKTNNDTLIEDKNMIKEWLITLSANHIRKITNKINESSQWGAVFNTFDKCKDCSEDFSVDVPVNPVLVFF